MDPAQGSVGANRRRFAVVNGGSVGGFELPEVGSQEFWLWALVIGEVLILLWLRSYFTSAHGG